MNFVQGGLCRTLPALPNGLPFPDLPSRNGPGRYTNASQEETALGVAPRLSDLAVPQDPRNRLCDAQFPGVVHDERKLSGLQAVVARRFRGYSVVIRCCMCVSVCRHEPSGSLFVIPALFSSRATRIRRSPGRQQLHNYAGGPQRRHLPGCRWCEYERYRLRGRKQGIGERGGHRPAQRHLEYQSGQFGPFYPSGKAIR